MKTEKSIKLFLVGLHIMFGFMILNPVLSKSLNILLLFVGFMSILKSSNKNNEAILWSAYMVGSEVLFRMSKGYIFYETSKYMVFLFLVTGLIVEKRNHRISEEYIIYIILLLLGISFTDIPYMESLRTNIIFNLSGPVLLGLCALYFNNRSISFEKVLEMLTYLVLPMISMVSYLYFKTPDLREIIFTANSNYSVSGGFGPNQVATILGLGAFAFMVLLIYKKRVSGYFMIDLALFAYIFYRALLTMSRGGLITAILAMLAFTVYYILSKRDKLEYMLRYGIIFLLFGIAVFTFTSLQTRGMLTNRYTNRGTDGTVKEDVTTGRVALMEDEFGNFMDNPFFGVGVGSGKYYRLARSNIYLPTHNEMSRLLGEHGVVGLIIIFLLIGVPSVKMMREPYKSKAFYSAFLIFWFLTINHSAMRLAMPAFIYGLSVMKISYESNKRIENQEIE